jgi:hypothetical protein
MRRGFLVRIFTQFKSEAVCMAPGLRVYAAFEAAIIR